MKTQKYILITLASLYLTTTACSSHPEIKPYEAPQSQDLAVDETNSSANDLELPDSADGFLEDSDVSEEAPAVQVAEREETVAPLAKVEKMKVETAKPETKKVVQKVAQKAETKQKERAPASVLKNGYYTTSETCDMKASPSDKSASVGNVSKGKKLWLDAHNGTWLKAYKKKGTAYIPAHCVK